MGLNYDNKIYVDISTFDMRLCPTMITRERDGVTKEKSNMHSKRQTNKHTHMHVTHTRRRDLKKEQYRFDFICQEECRRTLQLHMLEVGRR